MVRTAALTLLGAALVAASLAVHDLGDLSLESRAYVALQGAMLVVCGLATLLLWRGGRRRDLVVVLAMAVAARSLLAFDAPTLSDDAYRFAWDGRVALEGTNPFRYAPADEELRPLRDFEVFVNVNRPFVNTIYPPTYQAVFAGANVLGGDASGRSSWPSSRRRADSSPSCSSSWRGPVGRQAGWSSTPGTRSPSWRRPRVRTPRLLSCSSCSRRSCSGTEARPHAPASPWAPPSSRSSCRSSWPPCSRVGFGGASL